MASNLKNLSETGKPAIKLPGGTRVGIVVSEYYFKEINAHLLKACIETLKTAGIKEKNIDTIEVPGSFELVGGALFLADKGKYDSVITLGCVIKGETDHDKYINHAVAQGLVNLTLEYKIPFVFGLLTPNTFEQARARAGGKHGNKGVEAANAALQMMALYRKK